MGRDGKTGETLLKSALAPMFRHRALRVLSWDGHNILGNNDGAVLSDPAVKAAKLRTKDSVAAKALGYDVDTTVSIQHVPSLDDWKIAWDHVHFEGFLGVKMSLQFTWQGCDSILAAPLVIDLARLAEFHARSGQAGVMSHLACFFKRPMGCDEAGLPAQIDMLARYVAEHAPMKTRRRGGGPS
jgi:myo-inositol-1-phosphate synthase